MTMDSRGDVLAQKPVVEGVKRGIIAVKDDRVTYAHHQEKSYDWTDPDEWLRADTIAWLVAERGYPSNRIKAGVTVPRRTPSDFADVVYTSLEAVERL